MLIFDQAEKRLKSAPFRFILSNPKAVKTRGKRRGFDYKKGGETGRIINFSRFSRSTMSSIKFTLVFVVCLIAMMAPLITAQCPSSNNARCAVWLKGGFCSSDFYTDMQKQFYCGNECGLCS